MRRELEGWRSAHRRGADGGVDSDECVRAAKPGRRMLAGRGARLGRRYWREVERSSGGVLSLRAVGRRDRAPSRGASGPGAPALRAAGGGRRRCRCPLHGTAIRGGALARRPSRLDHALAERLRAARALRGDRLGSIPDSGAPVSTSSSSAGVHVRDQPTILSASATGGAHGESRRSWRDGVHRTGARACARGTCRCCRRVSRGDAVKGATSARSPPTRRTRPRSAARLEGVDVVYYLVHSLGSSRFHRSSTVVPPTTVASEAERAGVSQIVYLGGLGDDAPDLSPHLRSRAETARGARRGRRPGDDRCGPRSSSGAGSAAFETIVALVDRLPVMIAPRWVSTPTQPIALADMVGYLAASLVDDGNAGRDVRRRRPGDPYLPRDDRADRPDPGTAAADRRGAGAEPAALLVLAPPRHAGPRGRRPPARRGAAQPDRGARRAHPGTAAARADPFDVAAREALAGD